MMPELVRIDAGDPAMLEGRKLAMPTVERHAGAVQALISTSRSPFGGGDLYQVDARTELPPRGDLGVMAEELRRGLAPASRRDATVAAGLLTSAYRTPPDLERPDFFARALVEALGRYPVDILAEMIRELHRTLRWFPTVAEACTVCERLVRFRRLQAKAVAALIREHERREEHARELTERAREEAERRERDEARLAELAPLHERLTSAFGFVVPRGWLDFALEAMRIALPEEADYRAWAAALEAGDPWAAVALRRCQVAAGLAEMRGERAAAVAERPRAVVERAKAHCQPEPGTDAKIVVRRALKWPTAHAPQASVLALKGGDRR